MTWSPWIAALGAAIVSLTAFDLLRTVLTVRGGGPVTGRINARLWAAALALHRRRPMHRALSGVGPALAFLTLLTWLAGLWLGWTLVFSGAAEAVVSAKDGSPADFVDRAYFAGYTLATLGLGDFHSAGPLWRMATVGTAASGLMLFTMAITYIVPVIDTTATLRQLATYVDGLGDDPLDIVRRSWDGDPAAGDGGFSPLDTHLTAITPLVAAARQRYLAYPILHYFHSVDERAAPTLRIVALDEAVTLLTHGVAERARLPRQTVAPLRAQLNGFLGMLEQQWIEPTDEAPPGYALEELRRAGIPCVDDARLADSLDERADHRCRLAGLVRSDGRGWDEVLIREDDKGSTKGDDGG